MDIDWNAELVDQLESHWQNQLRPRLGGLTDEEYVWEPAPGVPTIAWRTAHLIDVFGPPGVPHFEVPSADLPAVQYREPLRLRCASSMTGITAPRSASCATCSCERTAEK
jgi:hypothetical protein